MADKFHRKTLNLGVINMPQICNMGQTTLLSLPKEGVLRIFSLEKFDGFGRV
jgi:hypothetical protein